MALKRRGLLFEIECCDTAIVSHSNIPTTWASQKIVGIDDVPDGQTLSVDIDDFTPDAGGVQIVTADIATMMVHRSFGPRGLLDGDATAGSSTIDLIDASDFPSAGTIWFGQNAVTYGGKSSNQLTSCSWSALGSTERDAPDLAVVYGFNPTLHDRRCWLYWVDMDDTSQKTLRWRGYVNAIGHKGGQTFWSVISEVKRIVDGAGLRTEYATGTLSQPLPETGRWDIEIALDNPEVPFQSYSSSGWDRAQIRIDEELIEYRTSNAIVPKCSVDIVSVVSSQRIEVDGDALFRVGDQFDVEDLATGEILGSGVITAITPKASSTNYYIDYSQSSDFGTLAAGDHVRANYHALIPGYACERGAYGTPVQEHEEGATVDEYRVIEGDQVDILLWFLFSDKGQGSNGAESGLWDVFPDGWGLALPSGTVDMAAFKELRDTRSGKRRYKFKGPVDLAELLSWMGMSCYCYLSYSEDGVLRPKLIEDLYPDFTTIYTLDLSTMHRDASFEYDWAVDRIANIWVARQDYDLDEEPKRRTRVVNEESRYLRGEKPLPPLYDIGVVSAWSDHQIKLIGATRLLHRGHELLWIQVDVRLQEELQNVQGGDLINVNLPYIADGLGQKSLTGSIFVLLEKAPADSQGKTRLSLLEHPGLASVAMIAPSGLVASYSGTDVVLKSQTDSHFDQSGNEDVARFAAGLAVTCWDSSSLGTGSVNTLAVNVTAVDIPSRTLTLSNVPSIGVHGWELAADDLIRLSPYDLVAASLVPEQYIGIYAAIAEGTPPTLDGDDPVVWGG